MDDKEQTWLETLAYTVDNMPKDAGEFTEEMIGELENTDLGKYDL